MVRRYGVVLDRGSGYEQRKGERERHHKLSMKAMRTVTTSLMDREISKPWEDSYKRALRG